MSERQLPFTIRFGRDGYRYAVFPSADKAYNFHNVFGAFERACWDSKEPNAYCIDKLNEGYAYVATL